MVARSTLLFLSRREGLKDFATRFKPFRRMTERFVAGDAFDDTGNAKLPARRRLASNTSYVCLCSALTYSTFS